MRELSFVLLSHWLSAFHSQTCDTILEMVQERERDIVNSNLHVLWNVNKKSYIIMN